MAVMAEGLRERKKRQTRERIADTARRLFAERGFEGVTVAEIARHADVSEQSVFNYFPTKEDLVYHRLDRYEEDLLQAIRDREPGETVLAAFRRFLLRLRGALAEPPSREAAEQLKTITRIIVESPTLLAREQRTFERYTRSLADLIAEEQPAGAVEPWVVANALIGVHRALIDLVRRGILAGLSGPELAREVRRHGQRGFAVLERGLGDYGPKGRVPQPPRAATPR
jgi:AcrR family transcriptional regulator